MSSGHGADIAFQTIVCTLLGTLAPLLCIPAMRVRETFQFELLFRQMAHPAGPTLALEPMGVTISMCEKT